MTDQIPNSLTQEQTNQAGAINYVLRFFAKKFSNQDLRGFTAEEIFLEMGLDEPAGIVDVELIKYAIEVLNSQGLFEIVNCEDNIQRYKFHSRVLNQDFSK